MAKIDTVFKKEIKRPESHKNRVTKWIHYTKLHDNEGQYCNERDREEIEALADLIETDGEVLQDLLVRKIDTDDYEIIGGHKRRRACKMLVEERGKEEFAFLPCYINNVSDVRARFRLFSSNGHHEKTDYEKMYELKEMKDLLENYPEEFPEAGTGRMVERLARLLNYNSTSTVGEYLTISQNLGDKAMEMFRLGELKKSAAVELSGFSKEKQKELIEQGIIRHTDIKKTKKEQRQNSSGLEKNAISPERAREDIREKDWNTESAAMPQQGTPALEDDVELSEKSDLQLIDEILGKEKKLLYQILKHYSEKDVHTRKQKIKVDALVKMKCNLKTMESAVSEQPPLPVLKNNDQRKEWLRNYKDWGVWYEDQNIGAKYYKYDFENGARLIAEVYTFSPSYVFCAGLHLVGGPEPPHGSSGKKWTRHSVYSKHPNSEIEVVEFLKYVQQNRG